MRKTSVSNYKFSAALVLLVSVIFSACTANNKSVSNSSNANSSYETAEKKPYPKTMSNSSTATNTNSTNPANSVARTEGVSSDAKSDGERYAEINENPFLEVVRAPLSTFSIDVDTAAYANVRRYLNDGMLPPKDAVRIEELINYFEYDYPQPIGNVPFVVYPEVASCAWNSKHKIVHIGIQGKKVSMEDTPPSNLVFLIDVSGSMQPSDRLPLLKDSLPFLVNQLTSKDRVSIVVYAGSGGLVLPSTSADNKGEILSAIENLKTGGSTNGGAGIQMAYRIAQENFIQGGNNRVILATDGDFNVGLSGDSELVNLIENKRQSGVFLSVLGVGKGNLNDSMMEKLADKGNGNYSYIDSMEEARKALGNQAAGTLFTIAKDVKIQVEFNPAKVAGYRLIGYENRLLADRDFNDDRVDAGEIGAGHTVTAIYEIIPAGEKVENPGVDELKYSRTERSDTNFSQEIMTIKLRFKEPSGNVSKLMTVGVLDRTYSIENASENVRFASAVAQFGLLLRDSRYKANASFANVQNLAGNALGGDLRNYRNEFLGLVSKAKNLKN